MTQKKPAVEDMLVERYGLTEDFSLAMWMLRDGRMANGSLEGLQRDLDHRHIAEFYPDIPEETAIERFMRRGNIRMGFSSAGPCFEFLVPPSQEQLQRLIPWAHWSTHNRTDFCAIRHARGSRICESPWQFLAYVAKYMHRNVFDYDMAPPGL